ncbi:stress responsive protein [Vulcanibacillus modesticaldus]|uniref:Stress responsive protein n=1 Tax=Vulcanibacillus modesticaldus TaxID=337097 RepID=A0A1D2YWD3_9BACI|nr:Dabb family protein [Vulcanibacillus modesticaldus]OEG00045.1 stress responsive protein [Vulcanibacillus modesticaldus]
MIMHVVMWKLKDVAEGKDKKQNAEIIKAELEALKQEIQEIKSIEVGINSPKAPNSNYDVVLISEFEDFEALNRYATHPSHLRVGEFIKKVVNSRVAVDYDIK